MTQQKTITIDVGVDPGRNGAIGIIVNRQTDTAQVFPMSKMETPNIRDEHSASFDMMWNFLTSINLGCQLSDQPYEVIYKFWVESVNGHACKGNINSEHIFRFGMHSQRIVESIRYVSHIVKENASINVSLGFVHPRTWQAAILGKCAKGETKKESLKIAKLTFPYLKIGASDGKADAINIARYGMDRMRLGGE